VSCLEQRLLDSQIPWGTHWFIPADALDRVLTEQAIHEELNKSTNLSAWDIYLTSHRIWKHARKIFAILVSIGKGSLVSSFLTEGITDANLPINIPKGSSQQKAWITPIKTFGSWSSRELDDFRRVQWYFLSPIFTNARTQHYELDDNCVMPFIRDKEHEAKSGGFSDVWEVVIHPAHQKLFDSVSQFVSILNQSDWYQNGNLPIALKRLHSRQYDDFKHEANILTALAMKKHNHLIKLLATYKFRGQYHLMFPFANSNLRQYWEEKEPHLSLENLNWWLKQMLGLASALCTIHNFRSATPSNRIVQNTSQPDHFLSTRKMVMSREEERYGRHGDLKPENILWFETTESATNNLGILQIADLGLGAFHRLGSRSNVEAKSVGGSPTYVPPECALDRPISRAYDIWSLGCIFLECVIWLLEGPKGLGDFANDRLIKTPDGVYDDSFFIVALRSDTGKCAADVRLSVREWIRDLHTHRRVSAFIHDMLDLIAKEMLVVRPQDRITSRRLSQKLEEFTTRASTDEGYMLQEFAVAKRENEKHCRVIPDLFDWYWTIEIMTSIPTRKTISSAASDSSAQQLAAYAASVVTECTSVCLSTTWRLSRESVDDPAPDFASVLDLAPDRTDPILERFASRRLAAATTSAPIRQIAPSDSLISFVDGIESDEHSSPSMELEPALVSGSSGTSEASQDEDIFAFDRDHHDDHEAWIANTDSSLFGLELPSQ
jgi:serine/threonine protein kinase